MIWTVLIALSIPTFTLALQEEKQCPRKEDINPCNCEVFYGNIYITCESMHINELRKAFVNLRGNKNLQITIVGLLLKETPSDLFKGLDVTSLFFVNHNIVRFGDEGRSSFEGLEDTLKKLHIRGNPDKNPLKFLNITALNVLHEFDIDINEVSTLGNDFFEKFPVNLNYLEIRSNETKEIGDKAFERLVYLKKLLLIAKISDFRRSMLPSPAPYLEQLDLSFNCISSLPEDMFADMPSLRTVKLNYNRIARLPGETWSAIWSQLEVLNLTDNPLQCDNHIEWMFRRRRPNYLIGTCEAPEHYKGKELKSVIEEKSI